VAVGELAAAVHRLLREQGSTLAVAESLTGGLLGAALTDAAGASVSFRGGVVAYASELKTRLLGVPAPLLDRHGAVHPDVALAMARGVRTRLGATWGLATTGVAGPDPQDGRRPGTVHVALAGPAQESHAALELAGDRTAVRAGTVRAALELALAGLRTVPRGPEALA
jgi:nicotinamide-nucleotide amidase